MYESHLRLYLLPHLDRVPLAALTIAELRDDPHDQPAAPSAGHTVVGGDVARHPVYGIRCTWRAALNGAIREGFLTDNPARCVELPRRRRPHPVVWTPARIAAWRAGGPRPKVAVWTVADTSRFLTAIETDELRPLLYLVALRGLRRGERPGCAGPTSNSRRQPLTIGRTVQEHRGGSALLPPTTAASARTIPLDRTTVCGPDRSS